MFLFFFRAKLLPDCQKPEQQHTKVQTVTYHIGHASGSFLHPIDGSTVKLFQCRLSLGEQLIWEVTVKQNLLPVARQSQHRDARRDLEVKKMGLTEIRKSFQCCFFHGRTT